MKIAITANPNKPAALAVARQALESLTTKAEVVLAEETREALHIDVPSAPLESIRADVLIAVGGDGTFLAALQRTSIPLLPLNAGTVGFLAEVDAREPAALSMALDRLLRGAYFIEERMRLASVAGKNQLPDATNEVVLHTSQVAKMRLFEISIDGEPVGRVRADGIILATPTGSTSYALSALGPVIDPGVETIVVTALAPFRATQRAVLLDPLRTISVRLLHPDKGGVVVVDGQAESPLGGGESVLAYRSPRKASFLRFGSGHFQRLRGRHILPWGADPADGGSSEYADLSPPT
ncbi:MAG: NAD(+)/NADH kinase [Thermoplasmata archaeon]|nr:NAD(+)/NADH kinase [Thermoplasmata archaeon]